MGKQSIAIALISVIFGSLGVGFGILTMMNFQVHLNARTGVVNSWYDEASSLYSLESAYTPIPNLSVDFVVNAGEHVYISYNGNVRASNTLVEFKVCINNTGQEYAEIDTDTESINIKVCIAIQCVNNSLDPGTYTVTVWAREEVGSNGIVDQNTLFVQTYIP